MRSTYRLYLKLLVLIPACFFLLLGGFNILIDTYGIFGTPIIPGVNDAKNERGHITQPYRMLEDSFDTLVVGSSRVQNISCEDLVSLSGGNTTACKNTSTPHANVSWLIKYVYHANTVNKVKVIYFGLDFFGFNMLSSPITATDQERLAGVPGKSDLTLINDLFRQLFSITATTLSYETLASSMARHDTHGSQEKLNVLLLDPPQASGNKLSEIESSPFVRFYPGILGYYKNYSLVTAGTNKNVMDEFRALLRYCRANGIRVHFFINPFHSIMLDIFRKHGLLERYLTWKADLARLVDEADAGLSEPLFTLWDFSGYNEVTTERVIDGQNLRKDITNYQDAFHFTRDVGRRILKTVITGKAQGDFGVLLAPGPLPDMSASLEREQRAYADTNAEYRTVLFSRTAPHPAEAN